MEITLAILGDFDETNISQVRLNASLDEAGSLLSVKVNKDWIASQMCNNEKVIDLHHFDGIWGAPGNYRDPEGIIKALQFVRENDLPFLGT